MTENQYTCIHSKTNPTNIEGTTRLRLPLTECYRYHLKTDDNATTMKVILFYVCGNLYRPKIHLPETNYSLLFIIKFKKMN